MAKKQCSKEEFGNYRLKKMELVKTFDCASRMEEMGIMMLRARRKGTRLV